MMQYRAKYANVATAVLLALLLLPGQSHAKKVTRGCNGTYIAAYEDINGIKPAAQSVLFGGEFSAAGSCGASVPNRCRERARDALARCMQTHWARRWDFSAAGPNEGQIPPECTHVAQVSRYTVSNIKLELETAACCAQNSGSWRRVSVGVYGATWGDQSCGVHKRPMILPDIDTLTRSTALEKGYAINCKAFRKKYGCPASFENGIDRPGANYRDFELGSAYPQLCHSACVMDPKCRSWTFVKPGVQGHRAHCWLKSGTPKTVKLPCCISGRIARADHAGKIDSTEISEDLLHYAAKLRETGRAMRLHARIDVRGGLNKKQKASIIAERRELMTNAGEAFKLAARLEELAQKAQRKALRRSDLDDLGNRTGILSRRVDARLVTMRGLDRSKLNKAMKQLESQQETVRNERQMADTAFQNFDQKANQLYNLLSSVMKAMNEMRMGTVRNML